MESFTGEQLMQMSDDQAKTLTLEHSQQRDILKQLQLPQQQEEKAPTGRSLSKNPEGSSDFIPRD
ncbi:hypothetical protein [Pseudomonas fluorescens]|uniref:hypothetical protein n=1 Tax=Pseudomonas fluorescens TaxID=294 RepID=UPI000AAC8E37|nr:hypothetical protein [Pseudomonas fluorescens]